MLFLLKNHRVLSWNTLLLLAAFLLSAGCGPASSGSGQSQQPAATSTQPAAETVTQATGPVPETLWDKRADYEKEGQVVLFTDCGLYKGGTGELTGAKCEFKRGRWILLEPKLEPSDNLLPNGSFDQPIDKVQESNNPMFYTLLSNSVKLPSWVVVVDATPVANSVRTTSDEFVSPPYGLALPSHNKEYILYNHPHPYLGYDNQYLTFQCSVKVLNGDKIPLVYMKDYDGKLQKVSVSTGTIALEGDRGFKKYICTKKITANMRYATCIVTCPADTSMIVDDGILIRGYLPLDFQITQPNK